MNINVCADNNIISKEAKFDIIKRKIGASQLHWKM